MKKYFYMLIVFLIMQILGIISNNILHIQPNFNNLLQIPIFPILSSFTHISLKHFTCNLTIVLLLVFLIDTIAIEQIILVFIITTILSNIFTILFLGMVKDAIYINIKGVSGGVYGLAVLYLIEQLNLKHYGKMVFLILCLIFDFISTLSNPYISTTAHVLGFIFGLISWKIFKLYKEE